MFNAPPPVEMNKQLLDYFFCPICNYLKESKLLAIHNYVSRRLSEARKTCLPSVTGAPGRTLGRRSVCATPFPRTKEAYLSQKVCRQGRTLGFLYRSRHILQIRNCLSIWRTTGLGMLVASLAILDHWHGGPAVFDPAHCCCQTEKPKWKHI